MNFGFPVEHQGTGMNHTAAILANPQGRRPWRREGVGADVISLWGGSLALYSAERGAPRFSVPPGGTMAPPPYQGEGPTVV